MSIRLFFSLPVLACSLLFCACTKEPPVCEPCEAAYANTVKIKQIRAIGADGQEIATLDFHYRNSLLDSLTVQSASTLEQYRILYNNCLISGYMLHTLHHESQDIWLTDGLFMTAGSQVIKKDITTFRMRPFEGSRLLKKYAYTNRSDGKVTGRLEHCQGVGCPSLGRTNAYSYTPQLNVENTNAFFEQSGYHTSAMSYDNRTNPFAMQDHILYYLPLQHFSTLFAFKSIHLDVFDITALNRNNPLQFNVHEGLNNNTQYTFSYAYNSANLPTSVKLYAAVPPDPANPDVYGPPELVGELRITY